MEEKPSRLIAELRSPEHRPSLVAFVVVAIVCSMVVATGIRLETVGRVLNPFPSWLLAIGSDLVDDEPSLRAVLPGTELEPEDGPTVGPEESLAPAARTPVSAEQRDGRGSGATPGPRPGKGEGTGKGGRQGKGRGGKGGDPAGGPGASSGGAGPSAAGGGQGASGDGQGPGTSGTVSGPQAGGSGQGKGRAMAPGQKKSGGASARGKRPAGSARR